MPDKRELTTIEALKASRHKYSFWRGLASLIGTHRGLEGSSVWDNVAFYNYVQHIVGTGARQRPDESFWTSPQTVNGFKEVLSVCEPDRVLVVGKKNWTMLAGSEFFPDRPPIAEPRFKLPAFFALGTIDSFAYWYATSPGKYALCAPIFHPGYPKGFYKKDTESVVDRLMDNKWVAPTG